MDPVTSKSAMGSKALKGVVLSKAQKYCSGEWARAGSIYPTCNDFGVWNALAISASSRAVKLVVETHSDRRQVRAQA